MATWGLAKAKAQLSEVVHEAETTGPQKISRSGREVAVLVSIAEWKQMSKPNRNQDAPTIPLGDFLLNSPLRNSGIDISRLKVKPRKVSF